MDWNTVYGRGGPSASPQSTKVFQLPLRRATETRVLASGVPPSNTTTSDRTPGTTADMRPSRVTSDQAGLDWNTVDGRGGPSASPQSAEAFQLPLRRTTETRVLASGVPPSNTATSDRPPRTTADTRPSRVTSDQAVQTERISKRLRVQNYRSARSEILGKSGGGGHRLLR